MMVASLLLGAALFASDEIGPPPMELELDPFYEKHISVDGFAIVGSSRVPDAAFHEAKRIVSAMLMMIPEAKDAMIANRVRLVIMAESEVTTDIPEHAFLANDPDTNWNERARGLGATKRVPVVSCAEENVLAYPSDRYHGESILIHEFAHAIMDTGLVDIHPNFVRELTELYDQALAEGLWEDTYAATNIQEYWAEGVQSWFDANRTADPPNGVHNHVGTREALREYDPRLAEFLGRFFTDQWSYVPPEPRWLPRPIAS